MGRFARLAQRLFNTPHMCRPERMEMLCAALVDRLGIAKLDRIDGTSLDAAQLRLKAMDWDGPVRKPTARDMYEVVEAVAHIHIDGTLVHKLGGVEPYSGMIGYDCLDRIVEDARQNAEVRGLVLDFDTPGGETAGCFEFAKKIYAGSARFGGKPIVALVNEQCASAGYALASVCDRIFMPETGVTGSIGVWTMLVDFTKALDESGIAVTIRRAGDRKARGHPAEGWDEELIEKVDAWIDETWRMFANLVQTGRAVPANDILALEGDWFHGPEAVQLRLIDDIASPDEVFDALRRKVARG